MSELHKTSETEAYIADWRAFFGTNTSAFKRFVGRTARDQRANYESCKGRNPQWCSVTEYESCVKLLEAAAEGKG